MGKIYTKQDVARQVKKIYAKVEGTKREVKKAYVRVNGTARETFRKASTLSELLDMQFSSTNDDSGSWNVNDSNSTIMLYNFKLGGYTTSAELKAKEGALLTINGTVTASKASSNEYRPVRVAGGGETIFMEADGTTKSMNFSISNYGNGTDSDTISFNTFYEWGETYFKINSLYIDGERYI